MYNGNNASLTHTGEKKYDLRLYLTDLYERINSVANFTLMNNGLSHSMALWTSVDWTLQVATSSNIFQVYIARMAFS